MRQSTRRRSGETGEQENGPTKENGKENGHTTPEPRPDAADPGDAPSDITKPPSKKRKLGESPPWKSATTQTPTSFIAEDGRRKSGRTNAVPLELLPPGLRAASTRPKRISERQRLVDNKKKDSTPGRAAARVPATPAQNKSHVNGRGRHPSPSPRSSSRMTKSTLPNKTTPVKTPPSKKSTAFRDAGKTHSASKTTPSKPPPAPRPPPAVGTRKSARTATRAAEADKEANGDIYEVPLGSSDSELSSFPSEEEIAVDPNFKLPKFKLKFGVPKPVITHPSQVPPPPEFPSFEAFLNHEDPAHNESLAQAAEEEARVEAEIRNKIEDAVKDGLLTPQNCSINMPDKQPEPPRQYAHRDHLLAHALVFHKLLVKERKEHQEIMRKRNAMVMAEIRRRRPRTKEEIEQEEYAENRKSFKEQMAQLRRKWDEVIKEVENRRRLRAEEEQRLAGKEHLNLMLEHSTQLLEARRGDRQASLTTPSEMDMDDDIEESDGDDADLEDEGEEGSEVADEDNMSNESEDEDDVDKDDDENLTVEQLKAKYAGITAEPEPTTNGLHFDEDTDMDEVDLLDPYGYRGPESDVDMRDERSENDLKGSPSPVNGDTNSEAPELEEVPDIMMDNSDESVDMDSESEPEDESEDESEEEDAGGLLGFYGGLGGLSSQVDDGQNGSVREESVENDSDNEFSPRTNGINDAKDDEGVHEDSGAITAVERRNGEFALIKAESEKPTAPEPVGEDVDMIQEGEKLESVVDTPTSVSHELTKSTHTFSTTTSVDATPQPNTEAKTAVPFLLRGTLREYQHYGLDWLAGLYSNHTNGILADEMGLGKTIQTIALLAHLACEKGVWGPHLIVVPTSVMLNWEMEFKKWAPGFKILTYYGSREQRSEKRKGWFDNNLWHVCITSYQLVLQDQVTFKRRNWHYLILDEAHNIKNFRSQRWQTLLNFKSEARLLLTGTPLQNNLIELWSLLYFLMPSGATSMPAGFTNLKEFQEWFAHPVDQLMEGGREAMDAEARTTVTKLHRVLRPYLLRRLKSEVEKQMPGKYEHVVYCRLSKRQRYLYDDFMSMAKTRETLASGNYLSIINCLMQLRKVCNHPDLFETRQIVTSFAMPKSVVADYEATELLFRRRLLQEDSFNPFFSTDFLEFVGLVPAKKNHLSTRHTDEISRLSTTELLRRHYEDKAAEIEPVEKDLSTVKGNAAYMKYQSELSHLDQLKSCVRLNRIRTQYQPLLGSNLVDLCTDGICVGPIKPFPKRREQITDWYLNRSELICDMVPTLERRSGSMTTTIDKFGCVTPAVVATDMPQIALAGRGVEVVQKVQEATTSDPFFTSRMRLSIAFPDKRLLQYDCGKLQRLDALLRNLQVGGHRALIFTQMTKVLDILEQFLNIHGHRYLRLDGATKVEQRQILTDRFNNDPRIPVFILSTRSGGLGINLTGADTVIFYDLDWNPAMDKQCQDRCHRIGQTRDVHIYRFVSEYTIESNILRKSNQKRMLDDIIIQEGEFTTDYFNKLTIRDMLGDEVLKDLDVKEDQPILPGTNVEKALEAAEDVEDATAAKVAQKEVVDTDVADFAEKGASQAPKEVSTVTQKEASISRDATSAPETAAAATPRENFEYLELNKGLGHDIYGVDWGRVDREPEHVDEYMLRYMEWEFIDVPVVLPDKSRNKRKKNKKGKPF